MITNETMPQEPINYIVMPAIYQHSYELKKVGHRQFCQPTNGLAVLDDGTISLDLDRYFLEESDCYKGLSIYRISTLSCR